MIGFSIFSPVEGLGQDVVNWFGHSISEGIGGFSSWAIGGVIHAMQSTTTPDFTIVVRRSLAGDARAWLPGCRSRSCSWGSARQRCEAT